MNHKLKIILLSMLLGCEPTVPDTIGVSSYPEINELLNSQIKNLHNYNLKKKVVLDDESEIKEFQMDSVKWKQEFSFLDEINPNQSEYVGAFTQSQSSNKLTLTLNEEEQGSLKSFFHQNQNGIDIIKAIVHEDKDVYVHHKSIDLELSNGLISSYHIDGYQKIMFKDTIKFRIEGTVSSN